MKNIKMVPVVNVYSYSFIVGNYPTWIEVIGDVIGAAPGLLIPVAGGIIFNSWLAFGLLMGASSMFNIYPFYRLIKLIIKGIF